MKKIKLAFFKACYWFDYRFGPYMVNERKYGIYLKGLLEQQQRIQELESEIKSKIT